MANGILILAEHLRGEVADITFEMLGAGRRLADALKAPLHVAVIGKGAASVTAGLGLADAVFVVETPESEVPPASTVAGLLQGLVEQKQEALVLVGWTNLTMGVGSVLSARAGLPFVNFCQRRARRGRRGRGHQPVVRRQDPLRRPARGRARGSSASRPARSPPTPAGATRRPRWRPWP